jgi:hypothetical protein
VFSLVLLYNRNPMKISRLTSAALALVSVVLMTGTVSAQASEDPEPEVSTPADPYDRLLAASVTLGIDTPYGIAGAALELSPVRYLGIYAGGGIGREGPRFVAGLLPHFPVGHLSVGLMLGVEGGPFDWDSQGDEQTTTRRHWDFALFFNTGVTFEYRWDNGLFGRLAFGAEKLITPGEADLCQFPDGSDCGPVTGNGNAYTPVRGWAGLTVGYAFEL